MWLKAGSHRLRKTMTLCGCFLSSQLLLPSVHIHFSQRTYKTVERIILGVFVESISPKTKTTKKSRVLSACFWLCKQPVIAGPACGCEWLNYIAVDVLVELAFNVQSAPTA